MNYEQAGKSGKICANCAYFVRWIKTGKQRGDGYCWRFPPVPIAGVAFGFTIDAHSAHPTVEPTDYCAEFKKE